MLAHGFAAYERGGELRPWTYEMAPLGPHDVEIAVDVCGVCHTDYGLVIDEYGWSTFPMCPGHEVIGRVVAVGDSVRSLAVGDRVGVGPQRNCCLECDECSSGHENMCARRHETPDVAAYGTSQPIFRGFADALRVNANFAFRIPDELPSVGAAPLLCAGGTVWDPLSRYVSPGDTVGVVGVGGLGHLALQFAAKMGALTYAISRDMSKDADARALGARGTIAASDADAMKAAEDTFNLLLLTVTAHVPLSPYLRLLKSGGTLCIVGSCGPTLLDVPTLLVMMKQLRIIGSAMTTRKGMRDMLRFAARHGVVAMVDSVLPFEKVNEAIAKVRENKAKYRVVLSRSAES